MKMTQMVLEFHVAMDVPYYDTPVIPDRMRCRLRQDLMQEEISELNKAIDQRDIIEIADGLADTLYVVLGTAWEFGLAHCLGEVFYEVHRSNMTKIDPVTKKPNKRNDGKVMKPPTYSPANLVPIIQKFNAKHEGT